MQFDEVLSALRSDTRSDLRTAFAELGTTQRAGGAQGVQPLAAPTSPTPTGTRRSSPRRCSAAGPATWATGCATRARVAAALDRDRAQLRALIRTSTATAAALADRESDLRAAVRELPAHPARRRCRRCAALNARAARRAPFAARRAARACAPPGPTVDGAAAARARAARPRRAGASCAACRATCAARRRRSPACRATACRVLEQLRALAELRERGPRAVRQRPRRRQGVPRDRAGPRGARRSSCPAWPARAARSTPTASGSRCSARAARRRSISATASSARRSSRSLGVNPPPGPHAPAAAPRRPVRDAGAARPAHDPGRAAGQREHVGRAAARTRSAKAQDVAVAMMRRQLKAPGQGHRACSSAA